ncbi:PLP-dependent aminotransferase family protein [Trinickia fusca]|uniref:PLP-dependent aminotransferase family protein n=1 Tax=Trinickia fusca TaxID=2419777 RepID=A0A494WY95_9BURK|nr:PLP-dependent aminotransferase family protein [Trinickia fusca]RKP43517.1 PLP-dependent aminotransferase family protein [Trinickia fusca]
MNEKTRPSNLSDALSEAALTALERGNRVPLSRQIYERLRAAIDTRMLLPGARVASARSFASELGVARGTVEAAYQRLAGEGYLLARGPAGTIVSPHLPASPKHAKQHDAKSTPRVHTTTSRATTTLVSEPPLPLQLGIPALDAFPRKLWSRLAARRIRATSAADLSYGDPCGYAPLRQAIAAYLLVSRGVSCRPEQVFVTSGYRASLALIAHTLLVPGDRVWVEDPSYPPTRTLLEHARMRAVAVPVDDAGLIVEQGVRRSPKARMAIVTPSHQAPLGVSMTMQRRLQLLEWAAGSGAWIVEDDYDGEFHYDGPPLPALKSLDASDRVLYAGSFSKVLFPGLGLGYIVVPERLVEVFSAAAQVWSNGCPRVTQAIVADFLAGGHFARHLKKMRLLYARRREWLVTALEQAFGERVHIDLTRGGMHLVVRVVTRAGDKTLARRAQQAGLNCQPLSARYASGIGEQGLLMGLTNVASAEQARGIASTLRKAWMGSED